MSRLVWDITPSWERNGFSPGKGGMAEVRCVFNKMWPQNYHTMSVIHKVCSYDTGPPLFLSLSLDALRKWDPGILLVVKTYSEMGWNYTSLIQYVATKQWDPGKGSKYYGIKESVLRLATPSEEPWVLHQVTMGATPLWDLGIAMLTLILVTLATVSSSEFAIWKFQQTLKDPTVRYNCFAIQEYGSVAPTHVWRNNAFCPGVLILAFIIEERVFFSQFWIKGSLKKVLVFVSSAHFFVTYRKEAKVDCISIILARLDASSVKQLALYKCTVEVGKPVVRILLNLVLGDVTCIIQKRFRFAVNPDDMIHKLYLGNNIHIYEGSLCMVVVDYKADKCIFDVTSQCAVQIHGHFMLRCRCSFSIVFLMEFTNQLTDQVMQILSSLCLLEVLPTYVSGHTFEVDFNLNNVATATTKQLFSWVILHDQNMHGNLMTLELKVKAYMQMCWHWHPDVLQSTICGTSKEMSELTSDRIPTTGIFFQVGTIVVSWRLASNPCAFNLHAKIDCKCSLCDGHYATSEQRRFQSRGSCLHLPDQRNGTV
nr:uncharacterized protein LOC123494342 isoform X1 [Aegilops tauschii subsp. strangulata]